MVNIQEAVTVRQDTAPVPAGAAFVSQKGRGMDEAVDVKSIVAPQSVSCPSGRFSF